MTEQKNPKLANVPDKKRLTNLANAADKIGDHTKAAHFRRQRDAIQEVTAHLAEKSVKQAKLEKRNEEIAAMTVKNNEAKRQAEAKARVEAAKQAAKDEAAQLKSTIAMSQKRLKELAA